MRSFACRAPIFHSRRYASAPASDDGRAGPELSRGPHLVGPAADRSLRDHRWLIAQERTGASAGAPALGMNAHTSLLDLGLRWLGWAGVPGVAGRTLICREYRVRLHGAWLLREPLPGRLARILVRCFRAVKLVCGWPAVNFDILIRSVAASERFLLSSSSAARGLGDVTLGGPNQCLLNSSTSSANAVDGFASFAAESSSGRPDRGHAAG